MTPTRKPRAARPRTRPVWRKAPPDLIERFNAALPVHPDAKPRKMFGYPACFVNGHFFVGLHNEHAIVRLPGELKEKFPELAGAAHFDPMGTGKGMQDWWLIPDTISIDTIRLRAFFMAAFAEIQLLPPKVKPARAASKPGRAKAR